MIKRLNLPETSWPICLLEFNQALQRLPPGQGLEITVRDLEIGRHMEWLARGTGDFRCSAEYRKENCRLRVYRYLPQELRSE